MKKILLLFGIIFLSLGLASCTQKVNDVPVADEKVFDNINHKEYFDKHYIFRGCLGVSNLQGFIDPSVKNDCTVNTPDRCSFSLQNYGTGLLLDMGNITLDQKLQFIKAGTEKYYVDIDGIIIIPSMTSQTHVKANKITILQDCKQGLLSPNTGNYEDIKPSGVKGFMMSNTNINK